jgi:hypothetical protein
VQFDAEKIPFSSSDELNGIFMKKTDQESAFSETEGWHPVSEKMPGSRKYKWHSMAERHSDYWCAL